jgi:beta-N-acetylhexosaminidase
VHKAGDRRFLETGHRGTAIRLAAVLTFLGVLLAACTSPPVAPRTSTASARPTHSTVASPTPTPTPTVDPIAGLSLQQRVGQLFMVGTPATAADAGTLADITNLNVGNIFLSGRSYAGAAATAAVVSQFTSLVSPTTTGSEPLLVATDQEGGEVQVLQGPGFSAIPTAVDQGTTDLSDLLADATQWGSELTSAGVNMNLAPVADLVPSAADAPDNPPIGGFDREFGYDPTTIEQHATTFRAGMESAGVIPVVKHFPGLGFVSENTDTDEGVTDTVTNGSSPAVAVYQSQIEGGASAMMVSSAIYSQIDATQPAVFSPGVIQGLLRGQLGFDGVVMSDDLSAAAQVQPWAPADRAILAIEAGVDVVLVSADPTVAEQMIAAVVAKAQSDPAFDDLVNQAARRVVALKADLSTN